MILLEFIYIYIYRIGCYFLDRDESLRVLLFFIKLQIRALIVSIVISFRMLGESGFSKSMFKAVALYHDKFNNESSIIALRDL